MVKHQKGIQLKSVLVFAAFWLTGCTQFSSSLISIDGSPINDLSKIALLVEDSDHPLLLRGSDGIPQESMRVPNAFIKYAYLIKPGSHVFWLKNVPYGHPIFALFERVRCYVIEVELTQGMQYRLKEDKKMKRALLLNDETGETVAIGQLVDEPWILSRDCKWQ